MTATTPTPLEILSPWYEPLTGYDPRLDGADCDHCPMRRWAKENWAPVPGKKARVRRHEGLLLGEAPGGEEVKACVPFVGKAGKELREALTDVGTSKRLWDIDNVIACRAPKDTYKLIAPLLKKSKAAGHSKDYEHHPDIHCRPRLVKMLKRSHNIIPMGRTAAGAVYPGNPSIMKLRGGPREAVIPEMEGQHVLTLPTLHPSFVRRYRRWRGVFRRDLERAFRYFKDKLTWIDPVMYLNPSLELTRWFFEQPSSLWSYDVETDGIRARTANLRCLGVHRDATPEETAQNNGAPDAGICIPFWSIDTNEPAHHEGMLEAYRDILRRVFTDGRWWTGHNAGVYDRLNVEAALGVTPKPLIDTILLHRLVAAELPHSLGLVGSVYTDVTTWKADNEGVAVSVGARNDHELQVYNLMDTAVTHRIFPHLAAEVQARGQGAPCPARPELTLPQLDHRVQDACVQMHYVGMLIDQDLRTKAEVDQRAIVEEKKAEVSAIAAQHGWKGTFNPASPIQVSKLLYKKLGLEPKGYTDSGDPSTNDECMRGHMMDSSTPDHIMGLIIAQRKFRGAHKKLTSFLIPLRLESDDPEKGRVEDDGRIHTDWKAHRTVTGRLASSPNCFDGETEVLTRRDGWRRLDSLVDGPELGVAQWNDDGTIEFVQPHWVKKRFQGNMVHLKRQQHIDMLLTPDHRCLVEHRSGKREVVTPEHYVADRKQIHSGQYGGGQVSLTPEFVRLICAVQADGHLTEHRDGWAVVFHFDKDRKITRLRGILATLGTRVEVSDRPMPARNTPQRRYIRVRGEAVDSAVGWLTPEKVFDSWVLSLKRPLLEIFAREVFHWDGCFTRMNHYSSAKKANADWVQTVLALLGHRANIRPYAQPNGNTNWQVDVVWDKTYSWTTNVEKTSVPHDGDVYCLSVPSSYVLIRRNGRIQVTGQCQNWYKDLRRCVVPAPGHVLVGGDEDQLEFRIAAARWGLKQYLAAFELGQDPHQITMEMAFGESIWARDGAPPNGYHFFKNWPDGSIGGGFSTLRNLAKRFQYACATKNTMISTLCTAGAKPIKDIVPGKDCTWTWDGSKYVATKIIDKRCHGKKACVKVTFQWRSNKGYKQNSVTFTGDHLFLLRDGTYRRADKLQPDDRLMPFRRGASDGYRYVDVRNDGNFIGEHRAVKGIYDKGDPRVIHHENRIRNDNQPENLKQCEGNGAHAAEHWDDERREQHRVMNDELWSPENRDEMNRKLSDGRRNSETWRASVADPATRRAATKKSWDSGTRKPRKQQRSMLDDFAEMVGQLPDREVAARAGCTPETVARYRKTRGIASPPNQRVNHAVVSVEPAGIHEVWDIEVDHPGHNFALEAGIFVHNSQYAAKVETVHGLIREGTDKDGNLVYADVTLPQVQVIHRTYFERCPEMPIGWQTEENLVKTQGFGWEPITGRRRDFLDGPDRNEIVNFPVQASAAGIMNLATLDIIDAGFYAGYAGPGTGLIQQGHDALVLEVPEEDGERCREALRAALEQCHPSIYDVKFTSDVRIGKCWKDVC